MLLAMIAAYARADKVIVSEADNLEGYIMYREGERL